MVENPKNRMAINGVYREASPKTFEVLLKLENALDSRDKDPQASLDGALQVLLQATIDLAQVVGSIEAQARKAG